MAWLEQKQRTSDSFFPLRLVSITHLIPSCPSPNLRANLELLTSKPPKSPNPPLPVTCKQLKIRGLKRNPSHSLLFPSFVSVSACGKRSELQLSGFTVNNLIWPHHWMCLQTKCQKHPTTATCAFSVPAPSDSVSLFLLFWTRAPFLFLSLSLCLS